MGAGGGSVERSGAVRRVRVSARGRPSRAGQTLGLALLPGLFRVGGRLAGAWWLLRGCGSPSEARGSRRPARPVWSAEVASGASRPVGCFSRPSPGAQRSEHRSAEPPTAVGRRGLRRGGGGVFLFFRKRFLFMTANFAGSPDGKFCRRVGLQILQTRGSADFADRWGFVLRSCRFRRVRHHADTTGRGLADLVACRGRRGVADAPGR